MVAFCNQGLFCLKMLHIHAKIRNKWWNIGKNRDFKIEFIRGNLELFRKDKISILAVYLFHLFRRLFSLSSGGFAIHSCTANYYGFMIRKKKRSKKRNQTEQCKLSLPTQNRNQKRQKSVLFSDFSNEKRKIRGLERCFTPSTKGEKCPSSDIKDSLWDDIFLTKAT